MNKVYGIIQEKILEMLDAGVAPWRKPWMGEPTSLSSGKVYRGINYIMLGCAPYSSPYWVTYKQAQKRGGNVRKGEKSFPCIFWKWNEYQDADTGEVKKAPMLRLYRVFNAEQCDGVDVPALPNPGGAAEVCDAARVVSDGYLERPGAPTLQHVEPRAYYSPAADVVNMPKPELFESGEEYSSVLFHELTHSTGHDSRLKRDGIATLAAFGAHTYTEEELIAEMGAAFLCGHCGIERATLEMSAAYIDGWRRKISKDPKLVVMAGARAQKAADLILGRTFDGGNN